MGGVAKGRLLKSPSSSSDRQTNLMTSYMFSKTTLVLNRCPRHRHHYRHHHHHHHHRRHHHHHHHHHHRRHHHHHHHHHHHRRRHHHRHHHRRHRHHHHHHLSFCFELDTGNGGGLCCGVVTIISAITSFKGAVLKSSH